ncbi:MAG: O-Antigen ligase [Planctomycetota bacterium]
MMLPALPWFDRGAALTRAWPPPSGDALASAMHDVRARDRHGDALHVVAAALFVYLSALDQAPNSAAFAILLTVAIARFAVFPVLFTPLLRWPPFWLGLGWVAWSALSSLWSPLGAGALGTLSTQRALLALIALFPVIDRARLLAWALVLAVGTNSAVQVMQKLGWVEQPGGLTWRPTGIVAIPAVAAINAGIAILLSLALLVGARWPARVALVALTALAAAGLVLSSSRHPALSLVFPMLLLPILLVAGGHVRMRAIVATAIALAAVAIGALAVFGGEFTRYMQDAQRDAAAAMRGETGFSSIHARLFWWRLGFEEWLAHPLRGGGLGSFRGFVDAHPATADFVAASGITREELLQKHPHSSYVRALAETGVVGFVLFAGAIVACLRCGLARIGRDPLVAGATAAVLFVALATAGECVELMNVAYAPAVLAIAIAALPRADGWALPPRRV